MILLTWIAASNDPFITVDGQAVPGTTLSLLFDADSPYKGHIRHAVVLYDGPPEGKHYQTVMRLQQEVRKWAPRHPVTVEAHHLPVNPIAHDEIFQALRAFVPTLRERFPEDEIVVNLSAGTGAKHTVWVLMAETGLLPGPCTLVQGLRKRDRGGQEAVVPVRIGLDTPLKVLQRTAPPADEAEPRQPRLDPDRYQAPANRALFARALEMAPLRVPVLILGERGTGKTTLAHFIRANSPYRKKALDTAPPAAACGQFAPELIRAELFGHTAGAFTGAKEARAGLVKRADGDTLFLDEVGDLPPYAQRLLIRAVESGAFTPVGATAVESSTFRLITATNKPWPDLRSHLHHDFLDRISYFTLRTPALSEVREDLPMLWRDVFHQAQHRAAVAFPLDDALHERIGRSLLHHPLPGNFRDLLRLAYHLIAALTAQPEDPEQATDRALLEAFATPMASPNPRSHHVLSAAAEHAPLDWSQLPDGILHTDTVLKDLRRYLAQEIRRRAEEVETQPDTLCDKSTRALQLWVQS